MNNPDKEANFRRLTEQASGRWRDIIQSLARVDISDALAALNAGGARHVKCPGRDHGKTKQQFRLFPDFEASGGGICNTCGSFPSGFKLLEFLNGCDFRTTVKEVGQYLDGRDVQQPERKPAPVTEVRKAFSFSQRKLKNLQKLWNGTAPLQGSIGETYLRNRGVTCELPDDANVRFHPSLRYWDADQEKCIGNFPGLVSLVKSPQSGQPITIHRTFLSEEGLKADVPSPKKLMPAAVDGAISELGGAIQLFPASGSTIGICEGIETALSIRSAHPHLPVWACVSAPVLTKFKPPLGVKKVVIWGDLDPGGAGQTATAKLAVQLEEMGIEAIIRIPGNGSLYVNQDDNYWATREIPIDRLIARLDQAGYRVTSKRSKSMDWADVWNESADALRHAIA